jgi:tetraprenyl-beta-curcumene synthase
MSWFVYLYERRAPPTDHNDPQPNADVAPLSPRQLRALAQALARHLRWGLPCSARELKAWRARARTAADPKLRHDALSALTYKRAQSEGAALFAILSDQPHHALLRLLVGYQIIWDYLDSVHEQGPDLANGLQLHRALTDAYNTDQPINQHYQLNASKDDSGYLAALTLHCRQHATRLPSFAYIRHMLLQEAHSSAQALSINHEPNTALRTQNMKQWVSTHHRPDDQHASWFELTAAAAAALTMFALLAEATSKSVQPYQFYAIRGSYNPWVCSTATMLDSYADHAEDAANAQHIYIDYYPTIEHAVMRAGTLIHESVVRTKCLRHGHRHVVIIASMVAMYLTRDSSRVSERRPTTNQLAHSGGTLSRILVPVLRAWRSIYELRTEAPGRVQS